MSVVAKNMVKSSALAMLVGVMVSTAAGARDIEAGPIWNDEDAKMKCPVAAAAYEGKWNGQWTTTVEGEMSVCGVTDIPIKTLEAGPIWNQEDADKKCPVVGFSVQGKWNGQWWTTVPSQMSVCQVDLNN